jgi:hypothetical protein
METPKLIETNVRNYMLNTLQRCHQYRMQMYTYALNIGVFILFVAITGLTLYYCYNRHLTPAQKEDKMMKDQQYILSKIRFYQDEQKKISTSRITNLPTTTLSMDM